MTMSIPAYAPAADATATSTDARSETSHWSARAPAGDPAGLRSRTATFAPEDSSSSVTDRPMPDAPPVTIAVSPANSCEVLISFRLSHGVGPGVVGWVNRLNQRSHLRSRSAPTPAGV